MDIEDPFYDETIPQPQEQTRPPLEQLAEFNADRAGPHYEQAIDPGFLPYAAVEDRELGENVLHPPEGWPVSQPPPECVGD